MPIGGDAEREAEGHRQEHDPAQRLGDRPEIAADRAAELRAHVAHDQREEHPEPLQRHRSGATRRTAGEWWGWEASNLRRGTRAAPDRRPGAAGFAFTAG